MQIVDIIIWELMARKLVLIFSTDTAFPQVLSMHGWLSPWVWDPWLQLHTFSELGLYTVSPSMPFEKGGPETFLSFPDTL